MTGQSRQGESASMGRDGRGIAASQPDDATLHDLIGLLYEAAVDPALWPGFMAALSEAVGASSASRLRHLGAFGGQLPVSAVDPECQALYRRLLPHLRRAGEMQRRMAQQSLGRHGALEVLDGLAGGVMVLDGAGCACYANKAAEKLLAGKQGLRLDQAGRVRAMLPWQDEKLHRLLGQAAAGVRDLEDRGCLRVNRSLGQPLALLVAPLHEAGSDRQGLQAGVLVFIHDPDHAPKLLADPLCWHFELTLAQARLAAALAAGYSVAECAETLGISVATARTHLRDIFAKTGARRQSDLVRLLLASPHYFITRGNGAPEEERSGFRQAAIEAALRAEGHAST